MNEIQLPYGDRPYHLPAGLEAAVVRAPDPPPAPPLATLLEQALDEPIGMPRIETLVPRGGRVVIIVSDDTRADPRRELVAAALSRLPPGASIEIAIASGTHRPCDPRALGLGEDLLRRVRLIRHDGRDDAALAYLGTTSRGTPVRIHRRLLEADLVIATGLIKPHYFAGFGAGAKAVFPGLGGEREIRINHELKRLPGARAGVVDDNPCRLDIEEAVSLVPQPVFLLNAIADARGGVQGVVSGDVRLAFREGARLSAPLFSARAPRSSVVVVSDALPLTADLYQASKLVAAAAPLVVEEGIVLLVAQCPRGVGPLHTVNRGIYEIGLRPRLPARHRVVLVSDLPRDLVAATYCDHAETVEEVLAASSWRPTVVPHAGSLILRAEEGAHG